jgi:hypothetical protein
MTARSDSGGIGVPEFQGQVPAKFANTPWR